MRKIVCILKILLINMILIHTVKCYDCYFIPGRYFAVYRLIETYEPAKLNY